MTETTIDTSPHQEAQRAWKQNYHDTRQLFKDVEGIVLYWCEEEGRMRTIEDHNALHRGLVLYKIINDLHEELKAQAQRLYEAKEKLSRHTLPEAMERLEKPSDRIGNIEFNLRQRVSASIVNHEDAFKWLKEIGADGAIKEAIHTQTLSAIVKQLIVEKGEYPPESIKVTNMNLVQIKRVK